MHDHAAGDRPAAKEWAPPPAGASHPLAALQRAAGNRAVARLVAQRDFSGTETETSNDGQPLQPDAPRQGYRFVQVPSDTPNPARARIDVHSVELSSLGYGHAFIVTSDDRGIRRYYRGGPTRAGTIGTDTFGPIRTWNGPYVPGTIDWTTRPDHTVTIRTGPAALGFDDGLATECGNIDASRTEYHPTGPNSNTTARELLARNGLPQRAPQFFLPGWNDVIPRVAPAAPATGSATASTSGSGAGTGHGVSEAAA